MTLRAAINPLVMEEIASITTVLGVGLKQQFVRQEQ